MLLLYRKEVYEKIKTVSSELLKSRTQRLQHLLDTQGYKLRHGIQFHGHSIDLTAGKEIKTALAANTNVDKLSILHCRLTHRLLRSVLHDPLRLCPALKTLELVSVTLNNAALQTLAEALTKMQLTSLMFQDVGLQSQRSFEFIGALMWQAKLQSVGLCGVRLNDYGLVYLLEPLSKTESLQRLDLSYNHITKIGIKMLEDSLRDNNHLEYIGLRQTVYSTVYQDCIRGLQATCKNLDVDIS
jgi:hypothetical protein